MTEDQLERVYLPAGVALATPNLELWDAFRLDKVQVQGWKADASSMAKFFCAASIGIVGIAGTGFPGFTGSESPVPFAEKLDCLGDRMSSSTFRKALRVISDTTAPASHGDIISSAFWMWRDPAAFFADQKDANVSTSSTLLADVHRYFGVRDYISVNRFIENNFTLQGLLIEVWHKMREYFGETAAGILEIRHDYYEPKYKDLFLIVTSEESLEERMATLERFENEWWFERSAFVPDSPIISLEP